MVLPGLIDSHMHPTGACMTEFDHPIPEMETIGDVLDYIQARAEALGEGKWIVVRQVFITRLKEQRYPTREELDQAAPKNPVLFSTGPDASLNSLALKLSGIDKDFKVPRGRARSRRTRRPASRPASSATCTRYVKVDRRRTASPPSRTRTGACSSCSSDYNSVGHHRRSSTATPATRRIDRYQRLHDAGDLTVRARASRSTSTTSGPLDEIRAEIRKVADHPLRKGGPMLRIIGIKTFLDGGMLTGSAYMREPWGVSKIYAINDPNYRGVLFIPPRAARADRPGDGRVGPAVHGPQRRRRRGARAARRLRGGQPRRRRSPRPGRASRTPTS